MKLFAVSFFGHRQVDDSFLIERQLESTIRELLLTKEYVEFLVGRDGESACFINGSQMQANYP